MLYFISLDSHHHELTIWYRYRVHLPSKQRQFYEEKCENIFLFTTSSSFQYLGMRGRRGRNRMENNQCLSPLKLWVRILLMTRYARYYIMWSSLSVTRGRSVVFSGYSTNKTDGHDIAEILLKVTLNTIAMNINLGWKECFIFYSYTHLRENNNLEC